MTILLTGGTGFIGSRLKTRLERLGHTVRVVSRGPRGDITWDPNAVREAVGESGAVVHLAGENVIGRRWTGRQKMRLRDSRVNSTDLLARAVADAKPSVFVTASAIGYYGSSLDRRFTERDGPGDDFLARLSVEWEAARQPAIDAGVRTATIRVGVVQHPGGGALGKMLLPFRLGVGGPVGNGDQWISWIHMDDQLAMFEWAIANDNVSGIYNGTAPKPATNLQFSKALGRVLRRPAILPAPSFALRIALGEAAGLLIEGQHVTPEHALADGFAFRFPEVEPALRDLLA